MTDIRYQVGGDNSVLKLALWEAWDQQCWWCRKPVEYRLAEIDHLVPKTVSAERFEALTKELGLADTFDVHDPYNLGPICGSCNKEKSSTDFSLTDRILNKLRTAANRRSKVRTAVNSFRTAADLAPSLLQVVTADPQSPEARELIEANAGGLVQIVASVAGGLPDYRTHHTLWLEFALPFVDDDDHRASVGLVMSEEGRRALVILEDVCDATLERVLTPVVVEVLRNATSDFTAAVNSVEVPAGVTQSGSIQVELYALTISSLSCKRTAAGELEFAGKADVDYGGYGSAVQDEEDGSGMGERRVECFQTGTVEFDITWDPATRRFHTEVYRVESDEMDVQVW